MQLIDTHAHLYLKQFDSDRKEMIENAVSEGVDKFFLPNIDALSAPDMLKLVKDFPQYCFPMMGLHPTSVKENYREELEIVKNYLEKQKFVAVGEIGIDLYWETKYLKEQQDAFSRQVELSLHYNLPIVVHIRNSFDEVIEILKTFKGKKLRGIFHCFTGNAKQAEKAISLGFLLGIGGVLTFKNSGLDKTICGIDLKHLVLETDSPYLAPVPFRGKRNESKYLKHIAIKLAEVKNVSIEEVALVTSRNALSLLK